MDKVKQIFDLPFMKAISEVADVYIVGGFVRDIYMNRDSKDVDIVVCGLEYHKLFKLLEGFGKISAVGKSFGVIKLTVEDYEFDIALPRSDRKIEGAQGHKSIESITDHNMTIEQDLGRRDFTINSIAIGSSLNIVDPFNGILDIGGKRIRCVNTEAFVEDPLRLMRAIQFASRFEFKISAETFGLLMTHKHLIKEITPERVLMEFEKVFKTIKDKNSGVVKTSILYQYLKVCEIFELYFGYPINMMCTRRENLAEFLYFAICEEGHRISIADFYKEKLKIDNDTYKHLKAIDVMYKFDMKDYKSTYHGFYQALQISPRIINNSFVNHQTIQPFLDGRYPKSRKELAIDGDMLISMGITDGFEIKTKLDLCLDSVLLGEVKNEKQQLINLVK